jgi:ABC-type antimicrobial peptide transport system permease subunit
MSSDVRFAQVGSLATRYDTLLEPWRLGATMFLVFGALALIVAIVGLYGILAFGVAQRRRELGIRAALGAERGDLIAMVLRQSAVFVVAGLVVGTLIALVAGRFVEGLLFDVHATDPVVYALVVIVLGAAALAASVGPAWRAAGVNPSSALQIE